MTELTLERKPGASDIWLGTGILVAAMLAAAIAARTLGSATRAGSLVAAAAYAAGTLAMAWWLARRPLYPRWSVYLAGAVLAASPLLSAAWAGDPAAWSESGKSVGWMLPWTLLTLGLAPAKATRGVCAANHPRAGWILVGGSLLMAVLLWLAGGLAARI